MLSALIVNAFAWSRVSDFRAGNYESYYGSLVACIVVASFGALLTIACPVLLLKKLSEPSLRLIFAGSEPVVGETFLAKLNIALPADQTPPIVATLKL